MMKKICSFLVACLVLFLVVRTPNLENAIVGKWESPDGVHVEFTQDGTLKVTKSDTPLTVTGKYQFTDGDRLQVEVGGLILKVVPQLDDASTSGDKLTLTAKGRVEKFQRVK